MRARRPAGRPACLWRHDTRAAETAPRRSAYVTGGRVDGRRRRRLRWAPRCLVSALDWPRSGRPFIRAPFMWLANETGSPPPAGLQTRRRRQIDRLAAAASEQTSGPRAAVDCARCGRIAARALGARSPREFKFKLARADVAQIVLHRVGRLSNGGAGVPMGRRGRLGGEQLQPASS